MRKNESLHSALRLTGLLSEQYGVKDFMMRASRLLKLTTIVACVFGASASIAQEPSTDSEAVARENAEKAEAEKSQAAAERSAERREKVASDRQTSESSLAYVESAPTETDAEKKQAAAKKASKPAYYFYEYSNPFLNAIARYETACFTVSDAWTPEQTDAYPYAMLRIQSDAMVGRVQAMIAYLEANPGLPGRVPEFTSDDVRSIARLARFTVELADAARLQQRGQLVEKWVQIETILIEFRKKSWWPQPQLIRPAEPDSDAPADAGSGSGSASGGDAGASRPARKPAE